MMLHLITSSLNVRSSAAWLILAAIFTPAFEHATVAPAARAQTYSGSATAVLGSSMTPQGTKQLAFEKARQNALKKFGTHVLSKEKLTSIDTPAGIREVSTKRIVALAAGETQLVDGSKQVQKTVSGEAIVYEVSATFKIEPTDFENTLRAYGNVGSDSRLRRSVETAVQLQEKLEQIDASESEEPEVTRLLSQTKGSYETISSAARELNGRSLRSKIAKQRHQHKTALLRYLNVVKKHGHPSDLIRLQLSKPKVKDQGNKIQFTYKTDYRMSRHAQKVTSACRQTETQRQSDEWIAEVFEDDYLGLEMSALIYLLDENKNVLAVVGEMHRAGTELGINYTSCQKGNLAGTRLWEDKWEFQVPIQYVDEISSVTMRLSKEDQYWRIAKENGFKYTDGGVWVRGGGRPV